MVVLPFVPVTASHRWRPPPGSAGRSRQASSTSPITSTPAAAAAASSGADGFQPGEVTTSSVPAGSVAAAASPSSTRTPWPARSAAMPRLPSSSRESTTVTTAPREASTRAAGGAAHAEARHADPAAGQPGGEVSARGTGPRVRHYDGSHSM